MGWARRGEFSGSRPPFFPEQSTGQAGSEFHSRRLASDRTGKLLALRELNTHPERPMKHDVTLTVMSLLTLLLLTLHLTHDTILQAEGSMKYPIPVIVFSVWLYATLTAPGRVWGYIVMLLGGFFGAAMIVIHAKGTVVGKAEGFFFVWTMFALAATGWVTLILSARGLWLAFRASRSRSTSQVNLTTPP